MNKVIILGAAAVGAAVALRSLSTASDRRLGSPFSRRMLRHMEHMLAILPENAPPKLVMSILPRLREQNDQIVTMLREHNAFLRQLLKVDQIMVLVHSGGGGMTQVSTAFVTRMQSPLHWPG